MKIDLKYGDGTAALSRLRCCAPWAPILPRARKKNAWFWEDFTADFGLWSMTAGMKRIWFIWEQHAMERRSVFPVTRRRRIWLS